MVGKRKATTPRCDSLGGISPWLWRATLLGLVVTLPGLYLGGATSGASAVRVGGGWGHPFCPMWSDAGDVAVALSGGLAAGATREDVFSLLGEPHIGRLEDEGVGGVAETWYYGNRSNRLYFALEFDTRGVLVDIVHFGGVWRLSQEEQDDTLRRSADGIITSNVHPPPRLPARTLAAYDWMLGK